MKGKDRPWLANHNAFWKRSNLRPLLAHIPHPIWGGRPYPLTKGRAIVEPQCITPRDVDSTRLFGLDQPMPEPTTDDLIESVGSVYPVAWLEAVIGCPILASAFGCVAKPIAPDAHAAMCAFSLERALESEWLGVMDAALRQSVAAANGKLAVRQLHLRGVIDLLAAYLGEEQLCTSVYDCPDELHTFADKLADLYIAVAKRGIAIRQRWRGGYVSTHRIFAPDAIVDYQIDASNLFSARMYEKHFLAFDRKILREFPYSIIHLHNTGLRMIEPLLNIAELRAIEIHFDRETGVWDQNQVLAWCQKIQDARRSLVLYGELNERELAELIAALDPQGLAVMYWDPPVTSVEEC